MPSVCSCILLVWRRSSLKKDTPVTYSGPALDPPLGGSCLKTTTLVMDLEYFIHTKCHQNPSSGSGEKVENVKLSNGIRTTDGRPTDRRTDAGQRGITIGHWSLRLLCPKKNNCVKSCSFPNWNFPYWNIIHVIYIQQCQHNRGCVRHRGIMQISPVVKPIRHQRIDSRRHRPNGDRHDHRAVLCRDEFNDEGVGYRQEAATA